MTPAAEITRHPARLAALCRLWREERAIIWLTLQGGSMAPEMPPGSRIHLDCGYEELSIGEVVAVLQGSRLVVHRLISIDERTEAAALYVCRGDANAFNDAPAARDQIVGVVREHRRPSVPGRLLQALSRLVPPHARALPFFGRRVYRPRLATSTWPPNGRSHRSPSAGPSDEKPSYLPAPPPARPGGSSQ